MPKKIRVPKKVTAPKPSAAQKPRPQSRGNDGFMKSVKQLQDQQSASFSSPSAAVNNMVSTVQHFIHSSGNSGSQKKEMR